MYAAEYESFKQVMIDLCIAVNRPFNDDLARVFWDDLRPLALRDIQANAMRLRKEGRGRFTSADLRPPEKPSSTFDPPSRHFDKFECLGNLQFFKFLRLNAVPNSALEALIARKNEIIEAARSDPDMQSGDEVEHGQTLHEILFSAWSRVLVSVSP